MNKKWSHLIFSLAVPLIIGLSLWLLIQATAVKAAEHTVCASGCNFTTIQEALDDTIDVNDGDTIIVSAGTYVENLDIIRSITIQADNGASPIIDGDDFDSVIIVSKDVTVTLSGLTIRNGNTFVQGGGIFNESDMLTINDSTISGNTAGTEGGGIANFGQLTINNVTIENNTADFGGGIFNETGKIMTLTQVLLDGNSTAINIAGQNGGGGIHNNVNGMISMTNVTFTNNIADDAGGGFWNEGAGVLENVTIANNEGKTGAGINNDGVLEISDAHIEQNMTGAANGRKGGGIYNSFVMTITTSTIMDNIAPLGAGVFHEGASLWINQSTISGNSASGNGGGLYVGDLQLATEPQLEMTNSTLSGNNASGNGGGVFFTTGSVADLHNVTVAGNGAINGAGGLHITAGQISLQNSIVGNNVNGDCAGAISSAGHNTASDMTCQLSGEGDDNGANPRLGPLANNGGATQTQSPLAGSLAIDRGLNCLAIDQRGVARPIGAGCDRGAVESSASTRTIFLPLLRK